MTHRGAGVYVFRTKRPGVIGMLPGWFPLAAAGISLVALLSTGSSPWFALLAFLFSPRHTAYVGESNAVELRRRAHLFGGGKFNATPKPWADLEPSHYALALPKHKKLLRGVETLLILLLWPVYNDSKNRWNPRRIPLEAAKVQRAMRDSIGWSVNIRPLHLIIGAILIPALLVRWM